MQKYFLNSQDFLNQCITGDDAFHLIKVMRSRVGEKILIGYDAKSYLAEITAIDKSVSFAIVEELSVNNELPVEVTIIQGYPKGDKFEDIIKHGTELGAKAFIPCLLKRSQFNVDEKRKANKISRFQKIAKEAAEQSFRNIVPMISDFKKISEIDLSSYDHILVCYEESAKNGEMKALKTLYKQLKPGMKLAVIIGPEGGITDEEIAYLESKGCVVGALGKRILRTETAVFYVLSTLSYEMELTL